MYLFISGDYFLTLKSIIMGCHTWFYKKMETPSNEVMYNSIKNVLDSNLKYYRLHFSFIKKALLFVYSWILIPAFKNSNRFKELHNECHIIYYGRELMLLKQNKDNTEWLAKKYASISYAASLGLISFVEGKGLYHEPESDSLPHDVFRVYDYPDIKLFSLEETLAFISNPKNECKVFEETHDELVEFWTKYPDGMICFG